MRKGWNLKDHFVSVSLSLWNVFVENKYTLHLNLGKPEWTCFNYSKVYSQWNFVLGIFLWITDATVEFTDVRELEQFVALFLTLGCGISFLQYHHLWELWVVTDNMMKL